MGKVVRQDNLLFQRHEWKRDGKKLVFTSGHFDLLHPGHIRLLEQARSLGDVLIVAVESDLSVGANRETASATPQQENGWPLRQTTPASERMEILAALASVDFVVDFDEMALQEFLARLAPDIVVKGGAPGSEKAVFQEDEAVRSAGATLVRIPLEPGYSTTHLIERITHLPA